MLKISRVTPASEPFIKKKCLQTLSAIHLLLPNITVSQWLYLTTAARKFPCVLLLSFTAAESGIYSDQIILSTIKNHNYDCNFYVGTSNVCQVLRIFISNTLILEGKFEFMAALPLCSSVRLVSEPQFPSLLNGNKNNRHFIEHYQV